MMKNRKIIYEALSQRVLAVAVINYKEDGEIFDWAAYIDSVDGNNHDNEFDLVARQGSKLYTDLAFFIFHWLPKDKYRL